MIKKIAAVSVLTLTLTTCSSPASANLIIKNIKQSDAVSTNTISNIIDSTSSSETLLSKQYFEKQTLMNNGIKLRAVIDRLKSRVGKTWYVFSGNTPAGWDCSGLTMWFYEQLNIELEHRASRQQDVGNATTDPKPGDLVVFKYNGYKSAYHVGIYIGDGMMIHAPRKGEVTRVESISKFGGNYSTVIYRNLIDTL
jgi:cell wall-associated NlpC family hydrolase